MEKEIIVNNLLIKYLRAGDLAAGKTMVFLHGWRSGKEVWQGVIERLKNKNIEGLDMLAMDLPGFGGSQTPTTPPPFAKATGGTPPQRGGEATGWSVGDYAEMVKYFIEKLELRGVVVVGHSFGGRVGIKLALMYPELIEKLVLVDSAGFAMDQGKKTAMGIAAKLVKPFFKPAFMQPFRKRIYQIIGAEDYVATTELQSTFVKVTAEELTEDMKKIVCPTLIVYGENDLDTPVKFGERMQSLIPNSNFMILENAGHFSFLDKPEEFVEKFIKFIL